MVERRTKDGGSSIGGSVFYAESCRESSSGNDESILSMDESPSTTLWIGSSTHSCSKVTILDGNCPQRILECFVLCSSHLLCSAAVPGVSEEDFEDLSQEKEQSPEEPEQGMNNDGLCASFYFNNYTRSFTENT